MSTSPQRQVQAAEAMPGGHDQVAALVDPGATDAFDRVTRLATRLLGVPAALLSLTADSRQVVGNSTGLDPAGSDASFARAFCRHVASSATTIAIDDPREHASPCPGAMASLGVPVRVENGAVVGALCVIHREPRAWSAEDRTMLEDLAAIAAREVERRLFEQRGGLARSADRFDRLVNLLPLGLYMCDASGRLRFYNDRAAALWGATPEILSPEADAYNRRRLRALDGADVATEDLPGQTALRERVAVTNREYLLAPERIVQVSWGLSLGDDDRLLGAIVAMQDVTEARRATRLRDDLLALVSHELRTPLTVINGMARVLERRIPASATGDVGLAVHDIVASGQRMARVVENMLLLSRLEHEAPDSEPVLVKDAILEALEHHQRDFPRSVVRFSEPERSLMVQAVPSWLQLILVNILNNAEQYGDRRAPHVLRAEASDGYTAISLCNTGELLQEDDYGAWFEPFYRASTTSAVVGGAGLGLTVGRKLADAQMGSLTAEPWPGEHGTIVTLRLPQPSEAQLSTP